MSQIDLQRPRPEIALLTLNRPEKLNALSFDVVEELHSALDDIGADNRCRVLVVTGAGRGFCSGLDMKAVATEFAPESGPTGASTWEGQIQARRRAVVGL